MSAAVAAPPLSLSCRRLPLGVASAALRCAALVTMYPWPDRDRPCIVSGVAGQANLHNSLARRRQLSNGANILSRGPGQSSNFRFRSMPTHADKRYCIHVRLSRPSRVSRLPQCTEKVNDFSDRFFAGTWRRRVSVCPSRLRERTLVLAAPRHSRYRPISPRRPSRRVKYRVQVGGSGGKLGTS